MQRTKKTIRLCRGIEFLLLLLLPATRYLSIVFVVFINPCHRGLLSHNKLMFVSAHKSAILFGIVFFSLSVILLFRFNFFATSFSIQY